MAAPTLPGLEFVGQLGSGGFADVFAYDQQLPARRVAVKVLREHVASPGGVGGFLAEANALAALQHPNIVPLHAVGVAPDGRPYFVMAYCPGPNFSARCRAKPLGLAETLRVGIALAGAVETAHRLGLLHRDIKPANVLSDQYGTPQLADFGLVGVRADNDPVELGVSVPWSAPEVLFGTADASPASDVYSLAATLWTLLVGYSPFEIDPTWNSPVDLLRRIRTQAAPSLPLSGAPTSLDIALMKAMDKDPGRRPGSALDLAAALQGVQRSLGLPVTEPVVARPGLEPDADRSASAAREPDAAPPASVTTASDLLGGPVVQPLPGEAPPRRPWWRGRQGRP